MEVSSTKTTTQSFKTIIEIPEFVDANLIGNSSQYAMIVRLLHQTGTTVTDQPAGWTTVAQLVTAPSPPCSTVGTPSNHFLKPFS